MSQRSATVQKKKQLWLICGGESPEHKVSLSSGLTCSRALNPKKYLLLPVCISLTGQWLIPQTFIDLEQEREKIEEVFDYFTRQASLTTISMDKLTVAEAILRLKESAPDVVLLILHGPKGEDGTIQGLFDFLAIPYTGSGVGASALAMDKAKTQPLLKAAGLPVPEYIIIDYEHTHPADEEVSEMIEKRFSYPVIIKPSRCGSSVGMTVVDSSVDLSAALKLARKYDRLLLIEQFISGVEVTCGVLDVIDRQGRRHQLALPPTEIIPREARFFDYEAKYVPGKSEEITPTRLPESLIKEIRTLALKVHNLIKCEGMSRVDIVTKDQKIYVLEINTIPGMTPTSLLPQGARAANISFSRLLDIIINHALWRHQKAKLP